MSPSLLGSHGWYSPLYSGPRTTPRPGLFLRHRDPPTLTPGSLQKPFRALGPWGMGRVWPQGWCGLGRLGRQLLWDRRGCVLETGHSLCGTLTSDSGDSAHRYLKATLTSEDGEMPLVGPERGTGSGGPRTQPCLCCPTSWPPLRLCDVAVHLLRSYSWCLALC